MNILQSSFPFKLSANYTRTARTLKLKQPNPVQENRRHNSIDKKGVTLCTLDTILNKKLCIWDGSNLFKTALAADSWSDEDARFESKRLSKESIASGLDKATDDSVSISSVVVKIRVLRVDMVMVVVVLFWFS